MKRILINALIILSLFVVSVIAMVLAVGIREGAWGFPTGLGILLLFLVPAILVGLGVSKLKHRLGLAGVLIPIVMAILLLTVPKAVFSTPKYSIKIAPAYLSMLLGIAAGLWYCLKEKRKIMIPVFMAIFPLIMSLGPYKLWVHKIEYGTFTGDVANNVVVPFELSDKAGEIISNESLRGKIVLFDFWFVSCGPCWVKFPQLQAIYEKYQSHPSVEVFAVNRPMRRDEPNELFTSIEEKGYSFPVLRGTQQFIDDLSVYVYPTVILLNKAGEVVFMGEIEQAAEKIEALLKE